MTGIPLASIKPTGQVPAPTQTAATAAPAAPAGDVPLNAPQRVPLQSQTPPAKPAAPAAPAPPAAPAGDQMLRVRFRNEDIDLPPEEARRLAQIGLSAQRLEEQRRVFQQQQAESAEYTRVGQLMARLAESDPSRFNEVKRLMSGGQVYAAAPSAQDDDDDGLTPPARAPSFSPDVDARLARIEQALQQQAQSFHQKDYNSRLDQALARQPYLAANSEAGDMARQMVTAGLQDGSFETPEQAAPIVAQRMKRLVEGHLESERRAREAQREAASVRSVPDGVSIPRISPESATYAAFKDKAGTGRGALKDWLKSAKAAFAGPAQT